MSIQQNFPAISPSLNLNFARSKTLDPRITFSRTSTATRVNEQGLVEVVSADIPRFDHEYENGVIKSLGLLVEEQRSNLITYSADFNNWTKVRSYISGVNVISPDGTESANKIVEDNSLGTHYVRKLPTVSADAVCAISVYVKSAQRSQFAINTYGSNGWNASLTAIYDLPTGNITGTNAENCTINAVGNGWYRATYIATKNSTSGTANVDFYTALNGNVSYQGDNSSGIYLWGAQLEEGAFPTSYIPTTASTATREPDNVTMTGDNFSDWYNQSEGTVFASFRAQAQPSATKYLMGISNNSSGELIYIRATASGSDSAMRDGGSDVAYKPIAYSRDINTLSKHCVSYKQNDFIVSAQGQISTVDDNCTVPTPTNISIGSLYNTTHLGGTISQLTYYPRRLTNTQLQNLTK